MPRLPTLAKLSPKTAPLWRQSLAINQSSMTSCLWCCFWNRRRHQPVRQEVQTFGLVHGPCWSRHPRSFVWVSPGFFHFCFHLQRHSWYAIGVLSPLSAPQCLSGSLFSFCWLPSSNAMLSRLRSLRGLGQLFPTLFSVALFQGRLLCYLPHP